MYFASLRAAAAALIAAAAVIASAAAASATEEAESSVATWGVVPAGADGPDGRAAFDYELDPGEAVADWLSVSNHSDYELDLVVYAHDAFTTVAGGFDLLPADAEPIGVGSWVDLEATPVTVPARSRVAMPFELTVPDNATPGDHAGGIVASLSSSAEDDAGDQVLVEHRVGARIYLRVSGDLDPVFEIEELDARYDGTLNPFGTGAVTTTFTVHNTGNVRLTGLPRAESAGPFGLGRRAAAADELPEILPGGSYTTTVAIERVLPLVRLGTTVEIDPTPVGVPDDVRPPVAQAAGTVWAIPWVQAALLALVAGAIVWIVRRRRRNAAKLAAALDRARAEGAAAARTGVPTRPEEPHLT